MMPTSLRLEELTWTDVRDALAAGFDRVIVAAGATEQHGPHMPLCVDALLGEEITVKIAERLGRTLVAPAVRPGCSEHHMAFPGTITLEQETMELVLRDYCRSLDRHGFKAIVLMVAHGGNMKAVDRVSQQMDAELGARVVGLVNPFIPDLYIPAALGNMGDVGDIGAHGGEAETSLMLAVRPDLVRFDRAVRDVPDVPGSLERLGELLEERGTIGLSQSGVLGDGTKARPELGHALIDALSTGVADHLRRELDGAEVAA